MIPHYLRQTADPLPDTFGNFLFRQGQVTDVIYPEDTRSLSKRLVEYEIIVQHRDPSTDTSTSRTYRATLLNALCGFRDRSRLRLRVEKPGKDGSSRGSKVVVLCLNGEHAQAVIVGGLRDERDTDEGWRDEGAIWDWEVNGVAASVDADGELHLKRGGVTDLAGEQRSGNEVLVDTAAGKLVVKPENGFQVGEGTEKFPKFSTYRQAEGSLHENIQNTLLTMATALDSIAVLHLIPVLGPILATPAFGQLGTAIGTLAAFIATFEGQSSEFVSRHTND